VSIFPWLGCETDFLLHISGGECVPAFDFALLDADHFSLRKRPPIQSTIMNHQTLAGASLFIVGVVTIMGIITAEATYPDYSTHTNDVSDLGATRVLLWHSRLGFY